MVRLMIAAAGWRKPAAAIDTLIDFTGLWVNIIRVVRKCSPMNGESVE
jgi:hypothetical protein